MPQKEIEASYASDVLDTCLKAGRLMIEGGSEMSRVEDTMIRIAKNAGISDVRCFITPTGIFMSLGKNSYTQVAQVKNRNINLELVDRVNGLSRQFADRKISLEQLRDKLQDVSQRTPNFPIWLQIFGAIILSAALMVIFIPDYNWIDVPAAAVVGGVSYGFYLLIKKYTNIRFISELVTALLMGAMAIGIANLFPTVIVDNVLIGALMTLVPGLALTNGFRDLFGGDLLSGIARIADAALTAIALGGGVGLAMKFFM